MAKDIFDVIQELRAGGRPFAIATVVETEGSVSAKRVPWPNKLDFLSDMKSLKSLPRSMQL